MFGWRSHKKKDFLRKQRQRICHSAELSKNSPVNMFTFHYVSFLSLTQTTGQSVCQPLSDTNRGICSILRSNFQWATGCHGCHGLPDTFHVFHFGQQVTHRGAKPGSQVSGSTPYRDGSKPVPLVNIKIAGSHGCSSPKLFVFLLSIDPLPYQNHIIFFQYLVVGTLYYLTS